eukprot:NP_493938.1 Uncharacterized protein CELE_Y57G7A.6 [Caenorhabditis elegans]
MIILLKIAIFGIVTTFVECDNFNVNNVESLDHSSRRQFARAVSSHNNEDPATLFKKLPAVARLITAIAIINGFSDGSIPADPVIAELLNIDTASLQQLEKFNKTSVDKFMESLGSAVIDSHPDTLKVEQAILDMSEVKMAWKNIGSLSNIPANDTLHSLLTIGSWDISGLKSFDLKSTLDMMVSESSTVSDVKKQLADLSSSVKKLAFLNTMKPIIELLEKWKPIKPFADIMELYLGAGALWYPPPKPKFTENAEAVNNISLYADKLNIFVMKEVVGSPYSQIIRNVTAGFANGISDIGMLTSDSKDQWLERLLKPSFPLSGVRTLTKHASEMKKLDDLWKPVTTESHFYTMRQVTELQQHLGNLLPQNGIETSLTTLKTCPSESFNAQLATNLKNGAVHALLLLKQVKALESISSVVNSKDFQKYSNSTNSSDIKIMGRLLLPLTQKFKLIQDSGSLQEHADGAQGLMNFRKASIQTLIDHLDCFKDNTTDMDKIASTARSAKILRKLTSDKAFANNFNDVSSAVSKSLPLLGPLRKMAEAYKNDSSSEISELKKLKVLQDLSKPFGDAVGALISIKKASSGADFETFVKNGEAAQKNVKSSGTPNQKIHFESQFGDFEETTQQIEMFLFDVNSWEKSIAVKKNSNLSAYGQMFADLAIFNSIDLKFEERLAATEGFDDTQIVTEFRESLLKLSKLDLEFSRYKSALTIMPDVLNSVGAGFKGKKLDLPVSGGGVNNVSTSTQFAIVGDPNSALKYTVTILIIGAVLGTIAFLWCWRDQNCIYHKLRRHYFKPNHNMKTAREVDPNSQKPVASQSEPETERFVKRRAQTLVKTQPKPVSKAEKIATKPKESVKVSPKDAKTNTESEETKAVEKKSELKVQAK